MKKVFHFDSQTDMYHADACVVSCFDARFELVTRKFLKKRGIWWADPLKIAGGAKAFASPAEESERSFALGQVRTSMRLHRTSRVMLMVHSDCGAYGGLQAFEGNEEREAANHESELRSAAEFLKSNISAIDVACYYLKFNGVWALEDV
ncbi:MAG TPA: carbonic anhydrase [Candidatus Binatia bacterium]|nr:carbonic anhydrase [Candidatus Binatia bacterium]